MVILMIYSLTRIGELRPAVEEGIRRLFPEALDVFGSEGSEGWNVDLLLPPASDSRAALGDLLQLLRTLPVPRDTYVVDEAYEEHYVYEDGETTAP